MKKYAVIDANNKALNFIEWDGTTVFDYGQASGNSLVEIPPETAYGHGWYWNGSTFVEPQAIPLVPASITPRQCRLILAQQGMLAMVENIIAGMDEATRITWEYALEFRRDDPLLLQLGANLGLTPEQIDQFFIEAAKL